MRRYRDLEVWQQSVDLALASYRWTEHFPSREMYAITSQIRRAAVSVACNIAEGQGSAHTNEFLNHLSMARASLMELETHLILSQRVGLLQQPELETLLELTNRISRMLTGLRKTL